MTQKKPGLLEKIVDAILTRPKQVIMAGVLGLAAFGMTRLSDNPHVTGPESRLLDVEQFSVKNPKTKKAENFVRLSFQEVDESKRKAEYVDVYYRDVTRGVNLDSLRENGADLTHIDIYRKLGANLRSDQPNIEEQAAENRQDMFRTIAGKILGHEAADQMDHLKDMRWSSHVMLADKREYHGIGQKISPKELEPYIKQLSKDEQKTLSENLKRSDELKGMGLKPIKPR